MWILSLGYYLKCLLSLDITVNFKCSEYFVLAQLYFSNFLSIRAFRDFDACCRTYQAKTSVKIGLKAWLEALRDVAFSSITCTHEQNQNMSSVFELNMFSEHFRRITSFRLSLVAVVAIKRLSVYRHDSVVVFFLHFLVILGLVDPVILSGGSFAHPEPRIVREVAFFSILNEQTPCNRFCWSFYLCMLSVLLRIPTFR